MTRRALAGLAMLAALSTPLVALRAQQLRGEVLHPDSVTRAVGVIVNVVDSTGRTVASTLTNDRGAFEIRLPRPGRYALNVLRVGFRPTRVPAVLVTDLMPTRVQVILGGAAVRLESITVRGENVCRIRQDSGQLVARLWEEARKALASTQLSASGELLAGKWIVYERAMDSAARVVHSQTVRLTSGVTANPFVSSEPDQLALRGYVVEEGAEVIYHAPDARALISDEFAATHCFRVEPPSPAHPEWVGVAFRPARERSGVKDIEGTFWLDGTTTELKLLEYRYTSVIPAVARAQAGGRVEFLHLSTGNWFVSRWHIRMPALARTLGGAVFRGARTEEQVYAREIHFAGGEVLEVVRDTTVLYRGGGTPFDAVVVSPDPVVPAVGASVALAGTGYAADADSAGRVRIEHVLPGPYLAQVSTAQMRAAALPPVGRTVEVGERPRATPDTLTLPTTDELLHTTCGAATVRQKQAMLYGTVRGTQRQPLSGATVFVTWLAKVTKAGEAALNVTSETRQAVTDDLGRWRVCALPRDIPLTVRARLGNSAAVPVEVRVLERPILAVELVIPYGNP